MDTVVQRPPSRSYERSPPPRSSSRNENKPYESPQYTRPGSSTGDHAIGTVGDKYAQEQPKSPEKRGSPVKRNLSRQPSVQKLSPQQSEQEIPSFRRGNETGASYVDHQLQQQQHQQQQQPVYEPSYETAPMESGYGATVGDDAYQYDANPAFSNYDLGQSQNYAQDGMQYGDAQQQPMYEDHYGAGEEQYYQPQPQQSAAPSAYMDNSGLSQSQYQPQYESTVPEYKYQPEPEYEYKPYQGQQQRQAAAAAATSATVVPTTLPTVASPPVAAQQPKPSYSAPPVTASAPTVTTTPRTARTTSGGGGAGAGGGGAGTGSTSVSGKPTRVVPQSRAAALASASSASERK